MPTSPTYKLVYFDARGIGEAVRWLFVLAGQDYEDYRFNEEEWATLKADTPCGQAPILIVDGIHKFSQTKAILRYLAKQFNFVGATDLDQARGDMIGDYVDDLRTPFVAMYHENDETKKKALLEKCKENLPIFLATLEKLLKANNDGNGYFVGDNITWTDMHFVGNIDITQAFLNSDASILDPYPKLAALVKRVEAVPAIAEWIKKRPVSSI